MKETIFRDHYIVLDPDGDPLFKSVTDLKEFAVSVYLADCMPSSTVKAALDAGFKLIRCDIALVNVREVLP